MLGLSGEAVISAHPDISRLSMTSFFTLRDAVAVQAIKGVPGGTKARTSARRPKVGLKSLLLQEIEIKLHIRGPILAG